MPAHDIMKTGLEAEELPEEHVPARSPPPSPDAEDIQISSMPSFGTTHSRIANHWKDGISIDRARLLGDVFDETACGDVKDTLQQDPHTLHIYCLEDWWPLQWLENYEC